MRERETLSEEITELDAQLKRLVVEVSLTGMEKGNVRSRSLPRRPFGTPRACSPCPCAGFFSETRKESSKLRLCCVYRP